MHALLSITIILTLAGCTNRPESAPPPPQKPAVELMDQDERAIIEHARDAQAAGEMLLMLHAAREMGMVPQ